MDIGDRAAAREDELRDDALASFARNRQHEAARVVDGARVCLDCDDHISANRLNANPQAVRCADCQQQFEHDQKRARGGR